MKIVLLSGGVGGAKLALGLYRVLPPDDFTIVVNTGDDFTHLGLRVCPDIDTLLYTLSGRANRERGWGREGETWNFMAALAELGGEDWFQLGDRDLALHVLRTLKLAQGEGLAKITRNFASTFGIGATVLPMTEQPVATMLDTDAGTLAFQTYFVAMRCTPAARAIHFAGAEDARPAPGVVQAIAAADAIIVAPSNPYLSVNPILAVPGIRAALKDTKAPCLAVSPLVGGTAVKGPTAKLMEELGHPRSNAGIASLYGELLKGLLVHRGDDVPSNITVAVSDTLMRSPEDSERVALASLTLAARLGGG